jgi:hypothetical protein
VTDASDTTPDTDGAFSGAAADTTADIPSSEYGDGTLMRLSLNTLAGAVSGTYPMTLTGAVHTDFPAGIPRIPDAVNGATLAIGVPCPVGVDLVTAATISAPAGASAGSPFVVTVSGTIHNNYSLPVIEDTTITLGGPGDCTGTGSVVISGSLAPSTSTPVSNGFSVTCTDPSSHVFTGSVSIAENDPAYIESTPGNTRRTARAPRRSRQAPT